MHGNSIFVFEAAGLCIAHLGHRHHTLTDSHLDDLGLIDVLLVPVNGSVTMGRELMMQAIKQINAPEVIPMHYCGPPSLARYLALVEDRYEVIVAEAATVILSRVNLPYRNVLVLPPRHAYSSFSDD